jgi:MinD superfamily P-loop ATPase
MQENVAGEWYLSNTRYGLMVHAKLGAAQENSGKLVTLVREKARQLAEEQHLEWVLIDGSPGIGCPVIASLSGVDVAIVVTEPTLSGLHDAERVIAVSSHFDVPVKVVVNKYDLNPEVTKMIEDYCSLHGYEILGRIPFDENVVKAMVRGQTIVEYADGSMRQNLETIWENLRDEM